jgi:hypothetical protein
MAFFVYFAAQGALLSLNTGGTWQCFKMSPGKSQPATTNPEIKWALM